jgi:ABC-type Fe3+/spermidine/putrescine transport system ATPase subunit
MNRIEVTDLVVRYGDVTAVDNISFAIAPGELVTLLGPSGCGKTTTLRSVAGLETPTGGSIRLNGDTVYSERRNVPAEKRGVSMVFQSYAIWPHMTVFDNVAYGLRVRKLPQKEVRQNVERVLDLVQMQGFAARPASKLSGGQQQRVAAARALASRPEIVFADEPTGNLDSKAGGELLEFLRKATGQFGQTIVMVTHDPAAAAYSERVLFLADGRIASEMAEPTADRVLDRMKELGG